MFNSSPGRLLHVDDLMGTWQNTHTDLLLKNTMVFTAEVPLFSVGKVPDCGA